MKEELNSIRMNETLELVEIPERKRPIDVKWAYKIKRRPKGIMEKYKVRLFVKGFLQRRSLDFIKVFSLMVRIKIIRLMAAIIAYE